MRALPLLIALALPTTALAQDKQYRQLTLTDGRVIKAEVLATEPAGLRMRVPQGETLVSFEILMDMVPIDSAEYRSEGPEKIWIHAPEHAEQLRAIYESVPNLEVVSEDNTEPGIVLAMENCGPDFQCMSREVPEDEWYWLVTAVPPQDDSDAALIFRGRPNGGDLIEVRESPTDALSDLWTASHSVLGLVNEGKVPKAVATALGDTGAPSPNPGNGGTGSVAWTEKKVNSASFVPIPGYTALRQGDMGGFALGLGGTAVGAGAMVVAVSSIGSGRNTLEPGEEPGKGTSVGQGVVIGGVGIYALNVVLNRAVGMKALKKSAGVGLVPTDRGGAMLAVGGDL